MYADVLGAFACHVRNPLLTTDITCFASSNNAAICHVNAGAATPKRRRRGWLFSLKLFSCLKKIIFRPRNKCLLNMSSRVFINMRLKNDEIWNLIPHDRWLALTFPRLSVRKHWVHYRFFDFDINPVLSKIVPKSRRDLILTLYQNSTKRNKELCVISLEIRITKNNSLRNCNWWENFGFQLLSEIFQSVDNYNVGVVHITIYE